jgi:hypothetical protein
VLKAQGVLEAQKRARSIRVYSKHKRKCLFN